LPVKIQESEDMCRVYIKGVVCDWRDRNASMNGREEVGNLPSISDEYMASLAAAASLALSKVTKPKPRERVGFSLREWVKLGRCNIFVCGITCPWK
jgi:hypothetical protein